jgi:hypothetical protein
MASASNRHPCPTPGQSLLRILWLSTLTLTLPPTTGGGEKKVDLCPKAIALCPTQDQRGIDESSTNPTQSLAKQSRSVAKPSNVSKNVKKCQIARLCTAPFARKPNDLLNKKLCGNVRSGKAAPIRAASFKIIGPARRIKSRGRRCQCRRARRFADRRRCSGNAGRIRADHH